MYIVPLQDMDQGGGKKGSKHLWPPHCHQPHTAVMLRVCISLQCWFTQGYGTGGCPHHAQERTGHPKCSSMRFEKCVPQWARSIPYTASRRQLKEYTSEFQGDLGCFRSAFCFIAFHFTLFFVIFTLFHNMSKHQTDSLQHKQETLWCRKKRWFDGC